MERARRAVVVTGFEFSTTSRKPVGLIAINAFPNATETDLRF